MPVQIQILVQINIFPHKLYSLPKFGAKNVFYQNFRRRQVEFVANLHFYRSMKGISTLNKKTLY